MDIPPHKMPLDVTPRSIEIYQTESGAIPYINWLRSLLDKRTVNRIDQRVRRIEMGAFGDHKSLGNGIYELRPFFGKGYRVYFAEQGHSIIVILCGGDKSSQQRDIMLAKQYWIDYKERSL